MRDRLNRARNCNTEASLTRRVTCSGRASHERQVAQAQQRFHNRRARDLQEINKHLAADRDMNKGQEFDKAGMLAMTSRVRAVWDYW